MKQVELFVMENQLSKEINIYNECSQIKRFNKKKVETLSHIVCQ